TAAPAGWEPGVDYHEMLVSPRWSSLLSSPPRPTAAPATAAKEAIPMAWMTLRRLACLRANLSQ
ncbi:MAG: hypothetical protein ACM3S1_10560, partial [Hyphomicrobiales bacterium]